MLPVVINLGKGRRVLEPCRDKELQTIAVVNGKTNSMLYGAIKWGQSKQKVYRKAQQITLITHTLYDLYNITGHNLNSYLDAPPFSDSIGNSREYRVRGEPIQISLVTG